MSASAMLVCTRLADMHKVHPSQDNSHVCSQCGQRVGVYPSGQRAIKGQPDIAIWCAQCAAAEIDPDDKVNPAGSILEIIKEIEDSVPAPRRPRSD